MSIGIKIVGIGGSLRTNSRAYVILQLASDYLQKHGYQFELLDLRQLKLPFCDGSSVYSDYPDVKHLREKTKEAQGMILVTPEYHGSVSGVLKNALDLLELEHMQGKVVALIGVLGGQSSSNALNTLRLICRHLNAWVIPEQLIIPESDTAFDHHQDLIDEDHKQRLLRLILKLTDSMRKLA